ncbi:MAG: ATP-binding protein [Christensenellales bacterium]
MQVSSNQVDNSYVVGSTQKINSFTLSNSKEFFDILSKNLYSDPLRAVIRETICNAWDSHIKADKTNIPIKAAYDGENIVVQDFGTGIPHEDIPFVYGVFGGSTKVLDDTQTGGFGLGCKAPFAITESFTVQNIYNGIKGIYTCIRSDPDNNGLPSIRTIVKVPTDEPNGITVTIPYSDDYGENRINSLIEDVIKFGGILANDNKEIELPIEEEFTICEKGVSDPYLMVRYGNVTYPIDIKKYFLTEILINLI